MNLTEGVILAFAASLGAVVGSFLNVCIWRMPRPGLRVGSPRRSHCPACGTALAWYDNIPLVSWLWLGGQCRTCRARISIRYFAVEALTGLLFVLVAFKVLLPSARHLHEMPGLPWAEFVVLATLVSGLVVASFIDMDLKILPDEITLRGMMLVPFVAFFLPGLHASPGDPWIWEALAGVSTQLEGAGLPGQGIGRVGQVVAISVAALAGFAGGLHGYRLYWKWVHHTPNRLRDGLLAAILAAFVLAVAVAVYLEPALALHPRVISLTIALLGMLVGSSIIFGVGLVGSWVFRKAAMGFGDVKLMGLLGGFVGWKGALAGFAIACLLGSVVGGIRMIVIRSRYLWFGPFLSAGCLLVLFFPGPLRRFLDWYMGLFSGAV